MNASAMRIFLTGATGYIGSAVLDALLRGGHNVTALVRDPEKAERIGQLNLSPDLLQALLSASNRKAPAHGERP